MKTEIKVTNDSKKPNKNGLYSLKLRIKNKLGRQTKSIGVTVGKDIWDETKGHLGAMGKVIEESGDVWFSRAINSVIR